MVGTLFDARPALTQKEVIWIIGLILGNIGYGAWLVLSFTCLVAFFHSSRGERWSRSDKILSLHVALVILCNTFLQVWTAKSNIKAIFYTDPDRVSYFYRGRENIFIVILGMLTEGILVWRCFMVHKVLHPEQFTSRWHHFFWAFPILLWLAEVVTAILAVVLLDPTISLSNEGKLRAAGLTFFLAALVINFTLNIFTTSYIITRLLLYRRSVIKIFGRKNALEEYPLHISSILLESAAINLPLALLSIIGLLVHASYAALLTKVITPGQCIASILVVYQVLRRKPFWSVDN